jgi:hypothetical protein
MLKCLDILCFQLASKKVIYVQKVWTLRYTFPVKKGSTLTTYFVWMFQFPPDNSLIKKVDITRMIKRSRNRSSLLNYNVKKHPSGGRG